MNEFKIKCPAKINLNLKVINKREDGFHNIESIMQTINLFDFLTIQISQNKSNEIALSGNFDQIPYNEKNLAYKAAKLFIDEYNIKNSKIQIYIEKNIPVAAGLAGGSTDAAGVLFGLYNFFQPNDSKIDSLCAALGSDLNVCLHGGRILATGRGEVLQPLNFRAFNLSLIKPVNLGISAKYAYEKYAKKILTDKNMTYSNDLEWAVIDDYNELKYIKQKYPKSVMTGSGSTYFLIDEEFKQEEGFWIKNNLKSINYGVRII